MRPLKLVLISAFAIVVVFARVEMANAYYQQVDAGQVMASGGKDHQKEDAKAKAKAEADAKAKADAAAKSQAKANADAEAKAQAKVEAKGSENASVGGSSSTV